MWIVVKVGCDVGFVVCIVYCLVVLKEVGIVVECVVVDGANCVGHWMHSCS